MPLFDDEDRWAWHYSRNGMFSVRSAYYLLLQENASERASSSISAGKFDWPVVWSAEVPPKTKHFAWRAIKEALAIREQLGK